MGFAEHNAEKIDIIKLKIKISKYTPIFSNIFLLNKFLREFNIAFKGFLFTRNKSGIKNIVKK